MKNNKSGDRKKNRCIPALRAILVGLAFMMVYSGALGNLLPGGCFAVEEAKAMSAIKTGKAVKITRITNLNDKAVVKWKKKGSKPCYVYVKSGKGKFKRVGMSRTGKLSFRVKGGKKYTVRIRMGRKVSKSVKFVANRYAAPRIESMSVYPDEGKTMARLTFKSKKGNKYVIYRKANNGEWQRRGVVKATGKKTKFYDRIKTDYTYTVRLYKSTQKGKVRKYGKYDKTGIETIITTPSVNLDATNLKTTITWDPVKDSDGYLTYIKVGKDGKYRQLASTTDTQYSYYYYYGLKTNAEIRSTAGGASYRYFVDPDSNPFVYIVRAYKKTGSKISYSNHLEDGEYSVITPNVLYYDGDNLTWHTVKNADFYKIYTSDDGENWTPHGPYKAKSGKSQKREVPTAMYYGVSSLTKKNGVTYESDFDRGFDVSHRNSNDDLNMLWIGCSTEWGSPYYNWNDIPMANSYPTRIGQMTGVRFFNASIPGATLSARYDKDGNLDISDRYRLVRNVVEHVKNGENTEAPYYCLTENSQKLEDFDIVVITVGGNDYTDDRPPGNPDDMIDTTYYGALNMTAEWIREADEKRALVGKEPIKIVFCSYLYGERYKSKFLELHDRFTTPNDLDLTYTDYQNVMFNVYSRLKTEGRPAYWIDLSGYVNHETCPYATSDNVHMTRFTYSQVGNGVAKDMIEQGILK